MRIPFHNYGRTTQASSLNCGAVMVEPQLLPPFTPGSSYPQGA